MGLLILMSANLPAWNAFAKHMTVAHIEGGLTEELVRRSDYNSRDLRCQKQTNGGIESQRRRKPSTNESQTT